MSKEHVERPGTGAKGEGAPPVAVVSGANRGIGQAVARHLREHGYRLSLGARDVAALEAAHGPADADMLFCRFDAFDREAARTWVDTTVARFGRLDALVNNAGLDEHMTLEEDDEEALDRMLTVNVKAPLRMTRLCLPHLEATGRGRIVNIVSLAGKRVRTAFVGYNISKFAAMGLTYTTRHVAWDKGVRVTALCPGLVRTEMSAYVDEVKPEDKIQPETIAELVRTLIELPNNAAIAELLVNCRFEHTL